jgi:hypothetical protein
MNGDVVMPLSGEEIIKDILFQVEKRLRNDCNFRSSDAYTGGYDGKIEIRLNLHGLDATRIDLPVDIGAPVDDAEAEIINESVEIERETDLDEVRERSGQGIPVQTLDPEGKHEVKKKTFARRQAVGGAL